MNIIADIFDRMDKWRNLPNYQLERRADLFFAVYLKVVLEKMYETKLREDLIPEFPVHIGTIYPNIATNKSFKIDYVAFAEDYSQVFFIELKTDRSSRREKQDKYLKDAAKAGLTQLIQGLVKIFQATNFKRKYFHLFKMLEAAAIVELPEQLHDKVFSRNMPDVKSLISDVKVTKNIDKCTIVYLQPTGRGDDIINFQRFGNVIAKEFDDPLTARFVQSLEQWRKTKAGEVGI